MGKEIKKMLKKKKKKKRKEKKKAVIAWYKGNDTSGTKMTNCSTLHVKNAVLSNK